MASDDYGDDWEVGARGDALVVSGSALLVLRREERDHFAEAVARAVTPGQVSG